MDKYLAPDDMELINDLKQAASAMKPDPQFTAALEQQLLSSVQTAAAQKVVKPGWRRYVRTASAIAAVIALCVTATLTIPPLRAIAQEVIDTLFNRSETNQETIELSTHGILQLVPFYFGTVEQAQEKVDFTIRAPSLVPDDLALRVVNYSPEENLVTLSYGHAGVAYISIDLEVFMGPVTNNWSNQPYFAIGASAELVPVEFSGINGQVTGEFVRGFWVFPPGTRGDMAASVPVEWDSELAMCRLRWQEDDMVYEIRSNTFEKYAVSCPIGQEEMIAIAESME